MKNFLEKHGWLILLLIAGLVLRIWFTLDQGFMNDELSAWIRTRNSSFSDLIQFGVKEGDMHPAFYQILLYYWSKLFGEGEFVLRIPAFFFYIGSCLLIYRIGLKHFTKWAAIIAIMILSLLTFPIIHTTLTRPYTSGMFFCLLAFTSLFDLMKVKWNWKILTTLFLGLVGAMYSHYFAFFVLGTIGVLSLFFVLKENRKVLVITAVAAIVAFLPHWPITAFQLSRGGLQWLDPPNASWVFTLINKYLNESETIICLVIFLPLFAYLSNKYTSKYKKEVRFSVYAFFGVIIFSYIVSYAYTPILRYKGMLFCIPLILLALGNAFDRFKEHHRFLILSALFIGFTVHTLTFGNLLKPVHYGVFKEVAQDVNSYNKEYGKKNITYFGNFVNLEYFNYYYSNLDKEKLEFKTTRLWDDGDYTTKMMFVDSCVKASETDNIALVWSNMIMVPMVNELIRLKYDEVKNANAYFNSGSLVFGKSSNSERKFRDSVTPKSNPTFYKNWKQEKAADRYIGELRIPVQELRKKLTSDKDYLLIKGEGLKEDCVYRVIVSAERNGETPVGNSGYPLLYSSFDMNLCFPESDSIKYFLPFELNDRLQDNDVVKVFVENVEQKQLFVSKPKIYVVNP